jgi:hypothetical protein
MPIGNDAIQITDRGRPSRVRVGSAASRIKPSRQLDSQALLFPLTLYFHCKRCVRSSAVSTKSRGEINWEKCIDTVNGLLLLLFHNVANYFISCFCLCALAMLPPLVLGTGYGSLM